MEFGKQPALSFVDRNDEGHALGEGAGWVRHSLEHIGAAETWKPAGRVSKNIFAAQAHVERRPQCLRLKDPWPVSFLEYYFFFLLAHCTNFM